MKTAIVGLGVLGWSTAVWIVVRWWGMRRPPEMVFEDNTSARERLGVMAARGAGTLFGAVVAGVLVMGLGGRLMMRVLAATSPARSQGLITDMDAVVGRASVAGSVGLVVFVGAGAGLIGWMLRLALRRWLPTRSVTAGLLGAGIGAGLLARSSSLLEPDSIDFVILSPDWLAVTLILGLIITFAVALAVLTDLLADRWPQPTRPAQWLWLAPLVIVVALPPLVAGLAVIALVRIRVQTVEQLPWMGIADRFAPVLTMAAAVVGAAWTFAAAIEILIA